MVVVTPKMICPPCVVGFPMSHGYVRKCTGVGIYSRNRSSAREVIYMTKILAS